MGRPILLISFRVNCTRDDGAACFQAFPRRPGRYHPLGRSLGTTGSFTPDGPDASSEKGCI